MSAQDSLVRLKQLNQPEASGFILAVVFPYLQTGLFGGVNTGLLTGVFYPRTSNPSGYLRSGDLAPYATLSFVSGNNTTIYTYVDSHFYPLASNPSGYITTGQTGNFGSNVNLSGFVTTGQTGQFYPSSNPSGFITSAQAGGIQSVSITGHNLSGVLTFSGLGGVTLSSSGQIVYFSGANSLNPNLVVLTTGNQTVSGNKSFVGSRTTILHGSGTDYVVDNIKNSSNKTILNIASKTLNDGGTFNNLSIDFGNRNLWDANGFLDVDWNVRELYDNFAALSLDWKTRQLYDDGGNLVLDWENHYLTGAWTLSGKTIATGGPYYPLNNPSGFSSLSGATGTFYPRASNPSGYLETTSGGGRRHVAPDVQFDGNILVKNYLDTSTWNLNDSAGTNSLNWSSRTLHGGWQADGFNLFDSANSFNPLNFVNNSSWYLQSLYKNGNSKILFYDSTQTGTMPYISGFNLINCVGITGTIDTTKVVFVTGNQSISGNKTFANEVSMNAGAKTRFITGIGNAYSINFDSGRVYDRSGELRIDWANGTLYGPSIDGTSFDWREGIYRGIDGNGITIEAINYLLYDNTETVSVNWAGRNLFDHSNIIALDWENRIASDASANTSIDFNNRGLFNSSSAKVMDWDLALLIDLTGTNSVDWHNRILFDSLTTRSIDWKNRQLSGAWNVQKFWDFVKINNSQGNDSSTSIQMDASDITNGPIIYLRGDDSLSSNGQGTIYFREVDDFNHAYIQGGHTIAGQPSTAYLILGALGDVNNNITIGSDGIVVNTGISGFGTLRGFSGITVDWNHRILSGNWNAQGLTINGQPVLSSGSFYPLNSNPSGYITTGQTGAFGGSANTGALTGVFYPLKSNPSGYVTSNQTGNFTGTFYPYSGNPSSFVAYSGAQKGIFAPSIVSGQNYQIDFTQGFIERIDGTMIIDLGNHQLYNQNGNMTADWNQNILQRDDGELSIDWNHNTLSDAGSIIMLDWTKRILTGAWSAGDVIVSGISIGATTIEGVHIVKSNKLNFKVTGNYNLFTVPTGFLFNIDTMEVITSDISSPSAAPYIQFGNTNNTTAYQTVNQTISNSQFARHIFDNPQDSINSGVVLTATISTASTASMHSGFLIYKGYLLRNS